jgi:AraC-like DNA-binding protein
MTPETFSTRSLRPAEQYEAWRQRFQPVFEVTPKHSVGDGFAAENQIWTLGGLAVSRLSAPPVRVARKKGNLRREPVDHWVLTYCQRGATAIRTERALLQAPASVPFLWSLGEESETERTHVDRTQIFMTRDAFRDIAPLLDAARASVLDTPLGHLLGDYILALERRLPSLAAAHLPRLMEPVRTMVAACVAPSIERVTAARSQIDLGRLERVRQAVRKHLRSPTLGPASLCRLVGTSRSQRYRLFEPSGGVARYIQRQRLLDAYAALSDPALTGPISVIADDLCFADASSFSRAFRQEFGHSPSEVGSAAVAGHAPPAVPKQRVSSKSGDFAGLLGGL